MDVAIVAPCPVPYARGGAENLWSGLQRHLNERTEHQAEVIKLPAREHGVWELVDSYRAFSELDLSSFDLVLSGKYPAWMVEHPRHVLYMLHPLRGLYDTYHYFGLPEGLDITSRSSVGDLLDFMDANCGRRDAVVEFFDRIDSLRRRETSLPPELLAFPGPFARLVVHWLDRVAMEPERIARFGAISHTVRNRPGYFPADSDVFVVHPPSELPPPSSRGSDGNRLRPYLFTVSRLDSAKRLELLIEAMAHVRDRGVRLRIAGSGPQETRLRELAGADDRIELLGRVSERELTELYAGARGVAFIPHDEDFGLVTLEAMAAGRPVISCTDSGGPGELVEDGVTGYLVDPDPAAIGDATERLWSSRKLRTQMGDEAFRRAAGFTWDPLVRELEAL